MMHVAVALGGKAGHGQRREARHRQRTPACVPRPGRRLIVRGRVRVRVRGGGWGWGRGGRVRVRGATSRWILSCSFAGWVRVKVRDRVRVGVSVSAGCGLCRRGELPLDRCPLG